MKVSEAIKMAMKKKKITQTEMANQLGTGQSNLSMWMRSESGMRVENVIRMANACGYDLVLVDRSDVKNAFVIGERDEIQLESCDDGFDERVRKIIEEEFAKKSKQEE